MVTQIQNMSTIYTIKSPVPTVKDRRCVIPGRTRVVLENLRSGERPYLSDNHKMEDAFRTGRFFFNRLGEQIAPQMFTFGDTLLGAEWSDLGLVKPSSDDKEEAVRALEAWRRSEVFASDPAFSLSEARAAFPRDITVTLLNPRTSEEVEHAGHLLQLFACDVLGQGLLNQIDLKARTSGLLKYEYQNKTLKLGNTGYRWDRYLFTKVFLTGIGYAAFYTLSRPEKDTVRGMIEACAAKGAVVAPDPTGQGPEAVFVVPSLWDVFALNFMQFQLLGPKMTGKYADLRGNLYAFFAKHFPTVVTSEQVLV